MDNNFALYLDGPLFEYLLGGLSVVIEDLPVIPSCSVAQSLPQTLALGRKFDLVLVIFRNLSLR